MPTAQIACPWCSKGIETDGLTAGSRVRCPRCGAAFNVCSEDLRAAALTAVPSPAPALPAGVADRPVRKAPSVPRTPASPHSWLLVAAMGGAALLFLIAATVGVVLLLAGKRTPQVAAAPTPPATEPIPDATDLSGSPDLHRKPLKEESAPASRPRPAHDGSTTKSPPRNPPALTDAPPDLAADPPATNVSDLPPEMQDKVNKAIDRGVAHLKNSQNDDGSWGVGGPANGRINAVVGPTALPGLTLLECSVPAADAHVVKAAAFVRARAPDLHSYAETYELALAILFLDRLGDPKDEPLIQSMALRLIGAQTPGGGWTYRCPVLEPQAEENLLAALRSTRPTSALELVAPRSRSDSPSDKGEKPEQPAGEDAGAAKKALAELSPLLRDLPAFRPPINDAAFPHADTGVSDNSCTQFAILGLWTARRHDVPMERTLALVNQRFRLSQTTEGKWGYNYSVPGFADRPSMTAVGLLGLAVGHGVTADLKGDDPAKAGGDDAVEKGMKALGESIGDGRETKDAFFGAPGADLYFLWSVERVGVLYNRKAIGDREWYPWGARLLVDSQAADGGWQYGGTSNIGSSFALLFLKRANPVRDLSAKLEFLTQIKK